LSSLQTILGHGVGRGIDAIACFRKSIQMQPRLAEAHLACGLSRLAQGDYAAGWSDYGWRVRCRGLGRSANLPAWDGILADSVGLALLVVLETLTPAERLSFVLHDMFGLPFEEIAPIVDRTPAAARQLASRARRRVRGATLKPEPDLAKQREVAAAFLAASRSGDFDGLLAVLDPDVVLRIDGGGIPPRARPPVVGAQAVARQLLERAPTFARFARPALVNGAAGLVVAPGARPISVIGFTVVGGRIVAIDIIADPHKLDGLVIRD
jgi:RNA polymerase sigma-70 factor (ECF subfamily)